MKKTLICGSFLTVAALLAQGPPGGGFGRGFAGGGRGVGMFGGANAYVTGAPFSATEVVQSQEGLTDGNTINRKYQTNIARDGQGRVRTEQTRTGSDGQNQTVVTILDYVGGFRYSLDSATMTATKSPLRTPPATRPTPPAGGTGRSGNGTSPTVTKTTLPPQVINGVLASGTLFVQTIAAGEIGNARPIQITRQTWISNDLKVPVQIKSSDPRFGTTSMDLTNIVQAEPSASLFVVPAGYTVKETRGMGGFGPGARGGFGGQRRQGTPPQ